MKLAINWKLRLKNKAFWLTVVPAILVATQAIAAAFGVTFDFEGLSAALVGIINAVFAILAIFGIVTDMTTEGFSDSERAMGYEAPYPKPQDGE